MHSGTGRAPTPSHETIPFCSPSCLQACALANLTNMKNCEQLSDSICDTKTNCYKRVFGMSFVDPMCVLVANNEKNSTNVSIKVWQHYCCEWPGIAGPHKGTACRRSVTAASG